MLFKLEKHSHKVCLSNFTHFNDNVFGVLNGKGDEWLRDLLIIPSRALHLP